MPGHSGYMPECFLFGRIKAPPKPYLMELAGANDRLTYMTPEVRCLTKMHARGYTDEYQVVDGKLVCLTTGKIYGSQDISIVNFYRFEGISNPDDMAIIYAIETNDGRKGTLIDAYGLYADDRLEGFILQVDHFENKKASGW